MLRAALAAILALSVSSVVTKAAADAEEESRPSRSDCKIAGFTWGEEAGAAIKLAPTEELPPGTALTENKTVKATVTLKCSSKLADALDHASLALVPATGRAVLVSLTATGRSKTAYTGKVAGSALKGRGVEFDVVASFGGRSLAAPVQWRAGRIALRAADGRAAQPPPATKRDIFYQLPHEIEHIHRPEHKQPPAVVPVLASAMTVVPLLLWLYGITRLGLNFNALPRGVASMVAGLFMGLLAAVLMLAVYFWMRLNVIQVAWPLAGLSLALVVTGHRTLVAIADRRIGKEAKSN